MSVPFVYVPESEPASNPFFSPPSTTNSPFVPPSSLFPASPFSTPDALLHANNVLWPESYESPYTRTRATSFHAPPPQQTSPFLQPTMPAFVQGHRRTQSWGAAGAPPLPNWFASAAAAPAQPPMQIHPFLNADAPSPVFHFDLAPRQFAPLRLLVPATPTTAAQTALLGSEIREPAFHPPLTRLRMLHTQIPFWPVDLELPPEVALGQVPISVGDVLVALHRALHMRISHADWETLSEADAAAVSKAFTKRCRAEAVRSVTGGAPGAATQQMTMTQISQLRDKEMEERNEGVKRVDFLLGKSVFRGLARVDVDAAADGDDDAEGRVCVRVVTAG
ncbi:hypothetical protein C8R45DRAFT_253673 [Mycena sanguinolenta]|nr:hypothetical protein C8R45DRAFT_253673 [Mycena sanguinolenta]